MQGNDSGRGGGPGGLPTAPGPAGRRAGGPVRQGTPQNGTPRSGPAAGRTIQSLDRAVAIVERLADAREGLLLTELARALALAPQTLQSLLRTLQHHGWVGQSARRGRYTLGAGPGEIDRRWRKGQDRVALAGPIVTDLCRKLGEYVLLAQWSGSGLVRLAEAQPDRELYVRGETLLPDRIHTMATGKMALALLEEPRRREIVAGLPLRRLGPRSVTSRAVLLKQLEAIGRSGVVVCIEEAAEGVVALAVGVGSSPDPRPVALGTALPLARYATSRRNAMVAALREAADAVARVWA